MKKTVIFFLLFPYLVFSQTDSKEKPFNYTLYGFLRSDFIYDSRQTVEALDGLLTYYPKDKRLDYNGKDLNDKPIVGAFGSLTRLQMGITSPEILKATPTGYIESDFTLRSTPSGIASTVRLRHVYIKLAWKKTDMLFGVTWHPLFVPDVFPTVLALNTGAPFQPFNRSPQLTLTHRLTDNFKVILSAIYQLDYSNLGPDGGTGTYLRNALLPNLHAQVQGKIKGLTLGAGYDFKSLQPRTETKSLKDKISIYETNEKINSYALLGYMKYESGLFVWKSKIIYGQNLTENLMTGGYALSKLDSITGHEQYGKTWKVGIFAGYSKNYGFGDNIVTSSAIYARGAEIESYYRIAPSVHYTAGKLMLSFEIESTAANYGTIDLKDKGKVTDTHKVTNNRVQLSATLFF
jgi:hypothetical protein